MQVEVTQRQRQVVSIHTKSILMNKFDEKSINNLITDASGLLNRIVNMSFLVCQLHDT